MSLVELIAELRDEAEELYSILAHGHPIANLAKEYERLEEHLVAYACCELLVSGDPARFRHLLLQAGFCRRSFLQRSARAEHVDPVHHACSRSKAVFAALAAADVPLARDLAGLSAREPLRQGEYEADFAYHQVIYALLASQAGGPADAALLRYESALGDAPDERLRLCRALHRTDAPGFAAAFADMLQTEADQIAAESPHHLDDPTFEPQARIFVEGLALLQMASRLGITMPTGDLQPLCPSIAICSPGGARPEDVFERLPG